LFVCGQLWNTGPELCQMDGCTESLLFNGGPSLMRRLEAVWRAKSVKPDLPAEGTCPDGNAGPERTALEALGFEFRALNHRTLLQYSPGRGGKRVLNMPLTQVSLPRIRERDGENGVRELKEDWSFLHIREPRKELLMQWASGGALVLEFLEPSAPKSTMSDDVVTLSASSLKVIINLHPVGPLHALLVPPGKRRQLLTRDSLFLALLFCALQQEHGESDKRRFKLTFNGMGAGASVNHQHWQIHGWPWSVGWSEVGKEFLSSQHVTGVDEICADVLREVDAASQEELAENGGCIKGGACGPSVTTDAGADGDVTVDVLRPPAGQWPLRSMFEFRVGRGPATSASDKGARSRERRLREVAVLAHHVHGRIVHPLQEANITHNMCVYTHPTEGDLRVTVMARDFYCPQSEDASAIGVSALEIQGHWIVPSKKDFDETLSEEYISALLSKLAIPDQQLEEIWGFKLA